MEIPLDVNWLEPWEPITNQQFERQFVPEVAQGHPLYQQTSHAIAHCTDCDDVLFFVPNLTQPYAVVHLTWRGTSETPPWPTTSFYASLQDWIERCMKTDNFDFKDG